MLPPTRSEKREREATIDLMEAIGSSLDIRLMLERAYPALLRLVPADYGALGISSSGKPEDYQWMVAKLPQAFFASYPDMAAHDFVRDAVARRPNVVLRDHDMVPRPALERNPMYRRAREVGAPLEQVMAVMLHVDRRWQSGLSLYRERRRPFSAGEQQTLQRLTPALASAVRNCHLFGAATEWAGALEALLSDRSAAVLLIAPPATEVARTAGATRLIERWFDQHECRRDHLPSTIVTKLLTLGRDPSRAIAMTSTIRDGSATLEISYLPLPGGAHGRATWMVVLKELAHAIGLPDRWRALLTPRELEVTTAVLRGWPNAVIADDLRCAVKTVKRHMTTILDKLGLPSRAALIARAAELQRD
jgi:DNA-binding CsgD family transcriptional regulator